MRYYIKAGRIKKTEIPLAQGLKETPGDARLNMSVAVIYRRRREYDKAVLAYGRALRLRPKNEGARLGRARSYLAAGKVRRAKADAYKALRAHPESSAALVMLGDSYRFKKDWKRVEGRYREALEITPESFTATYKL